MQKFSVKELTFWQLLGNRAIIQFIGLGVVCVVSHVRRRCGTSSYERTLQEDDFDWTDMILGPRGVRKRVVLQVSVCHHVACHQKLKPKLDKNGFFVKILIKPKSDMKS